MRGEVGKGQTVSARFAGRVRIARIERRILGKTSGRDAAVHLVRGNLDELFHAELPGRFEQREGAEHVGLDEVIRPKNRTVHVGFGGKVDNDVDALVPDLRHSFVLGNIALDELVPVGIGRSARLSRLPA